MIKGKFSPKAIQYLFLLLLVSIESTAQHGMGLNFSSSSYRKAQTMSAGFDFRGDPDPEHSLKTFCPTPGDQGQTRSCVGWASGYGALSIAYNFKNSITDQTEKNKLAFSGMYVYKKILPDWASNSCDIGTDPYDAMNLLVKQGDCRFTSFQPAQCEMPTSGFDNEAMANRIKDFGKIFEENETGRQKILSVVRSISNNKPVVIGMNVTQSFQDVKGPIWHPNDKGNIIGAHAMVVIGYSQLDRQFEIMNSWGTDWGNGGFFKISYDDFAEIVLCAYELNIGSKSSDMQLHGTFHFCEYTGKSARGENQFADLSPKLNNGIYQIKVKKDQYFKLRADNMTDGSFVYVFSVKPSGEIEVMYGNFGFKKVDDIPNSPTVPDQSAILEIPNGKGALQADENGDDYLIILFSKNRIENLSSMIQGLSNSTINNIQAKLHSAIGTKLVNASNIIYSDGIMRVTAPVDRDSYVVSIILKATVN